MFIFIGCKFHFLFTKSPFSCASLSLIEFIETEVSQNRRLIETEVSQNRRPETLGVE